MSFSGETNNVFFVTVFIKSPSKGILCTVALISVFLCWTPPSPPSHAFFFTRRLYAAKASTGVTPTVACCRSALTLTFKRETRQLICPANE